MSRSDTEIKDAALVIQEAKAFLVENKQYDNRKLEELLKGLNFVLRKESDGDYEIRAKKNRISSYILDIRAELDRKKHKG